LIDNDRIVRRLVVMLVFGVGAWSLLTLTASAAVSRFGSFGEGAGQIGAPFGAAIDQDSGDLYVVDGTNSRVSKFGPEGEFLLAWGWGVEDHEELPEVCTSVCFAGIAAEGSGQFDFPGGIAVDNDPLSPSHGDVYVADTVNERIEKFEPDGAFMLMLGEDVNKTKDETVGATAAERDLCTAASGNTCKAGVPGTGRGELELESSGVLAVDAAGTVYVGDLNRVQEFSEAGVFRAEIKLPGAGSSVAVAVDSSKDVYVESRELPGVREYKGCAVTCTGEEIGPPRDAAGAPNSIVLGSSGELFVTDGGGETHHIVEYDSTGRELASFDAGTAGGPALAFGQTIKRLYVLSEGLVRLVSPPPPGPLVIGESGGEVSPTTATLEAFVNPEGQEESVSEPLKYQFEYGETEAYDQRTVIEVASGGSFEDRHLNVPVTGLKPDTTYHFRVVATNAAEETTRGPDATFSTLPPALISAESASQVTDTSARLGVEIDPLGIATLYQFEYGRTTEYEEPRIPISAGNAGSGSSDVAVSVPIEGLAATTTYHYRVAVTNTLGETFGPDHTFTTQATGRAGLIDGRAWEMVSPPNKKAVSLEMSTEEGGLMQAAENGAALTYFTQAPIDQSPAGSRSFAYTQLLSARGANGWITQDLTTPQEHIEGIRGGALSEYQQFSSDLSQAEVQPEGATPLSQQASERTPYLRQNADGEYTPLLTSADVAAGVKWGGHQSPGEGFGEGAEFVVGTPDMSHVLLEAPMALLGDFESDGRQSLYEWAEGALKLVSILPNEQPAAAAGLNAKAGAEDFGLRNVITPNGARVIFETGFEAGEHHLYMRDMNVPETVQLDAPQENAKNPGPSQAIYLDASSDQSKIFFLDTARLTLDSDASSSHPDLYMCEIVPIGVKLACALKDLTVPLNAGEEADVLGADLGTDEAGRYIYFVANGVLAPGAKRGDCGPSGPSSLPEPSLSCNVYVRDTTTGTTRLIAVLSNRDAPDWQAGFERRNKFSELTSRVSANGRYVAFMSQRSLTGYDNVDAHTGQPDEEVFIYDVETSALSCASCDPTGARPTGVFDPSPISLTSVPLLVDRPSVWGEQSIAGSLPGWPLIDDFHALHEPRDLSDSGRLFFDSVDGLVPRDANGKEDVYEYEPHSVGSCTSPAGCVGLISSGESGEESAFVDAGDGGEDVFFMTASKLSAQDADDALDIYDAHVCTTSLPCPQPSAVASAPCDDAASCRAASPPQPAEIGLPGTTVATSGNLPRPVPGKAVVKPLTRAQKLKKALKACRRKRGTPRKRCEARARKRYGTSSRRRDK
jgi:hypothetical protein